MHHIWSMETAAVATYACVYPVGRCDCLSHADAPSRHVLYCTALYCCAAKGTALTLRVRSRSVHVFTPTVPRTLPSVGFQIFRLS